MSSHHIMLFALLVAGCSEMPALPVIAPYRMDIQQGNVVTQAMVAKLKPGMTRGQVRFALGTPLVVDPFRDDRWDYVYYLAKGGEMTEKRRIAVIFKDDKLLRVEGDVLAASGAAQAAADAPAPQTFPGDR